MTIYTTLNKIRECNPCEKGWKKLLKYLNKTEADDEHLDFSTIFKSNGLFDALWCTRSAPEHDKEWRLFAVWCARRVQHLMKDQRSIAAIDTAERCANGQATDGELAAAKEEAEKALWAAEKTAWVVEKVAWAVAKADAAEAAWAAGEEASAAAWAAAEAAWSAAKESRAALVVWEAADKAAWAVAKAAAAKGAAEAEASAAAWAAWAAEKKAQTERFLEVVGG